MREISPAVGMSVDEYLAMAPPLVTKLVEEIRRKKAAGTRLLPSKSLIDKSNVLTPSIRAALLDQIAKLTDENYAGRSEMCLQYADLLNRALNRLGIAARPVVGKAIYYDESGEEIFHWGHAWVRIGDEIIDGNVDSIPENPMVPNAVHARPYWGPVREMPPDRKLQEHQGATLPDDEDVENSWWPDLSAFVDSNLK